MTEPISAGAASTIQAEEINKKTRDAFMKIAFEGSKVGKNTQDLAREDHNGRIEAAKHCNAETNPSGKFECDHNKAMADEHGKMFTTGEASSCKLSEPTTSTQSCARSHQTPNQRSCCS